jgi:TATA-box binding protein (TBP) (component of TFIID and TFIIIB)
MDINDEWKMFLSSSDRKDYDRKDETQQNDDSFSVPVPTPLYISTKTNIAFLKRQTDDSIIPVFENENELVKGKEIDILSLFWDVPVIPYEAPTNGILKKQILIKSEKQEDLQKMKDKLLSIKHYDEYIITSINNPKGRVKFKDKRKISIGLCKKDITSFRCKQKSAFDNCVAFIMRLNIEGCFKEFHIKLFNTGKLEIPGVKDDKIFDLIIENLIEMLKPHMDLYLIPISDYNMEVLINSNFNCGFYIKRDVLYKILKYEKNISTIYDPCMYPGIQCKYNYEIKNEDGTTTQKKVSFMIFRTGSVLIVGKCVEEDLYIVYDYLNKILLAEFNTIYQPSSVPSVEVPQKKKVKKTKKKLIKIKLDDKNKLELDNK